MEEFEKDLVVQWYEWLEHRLLEIMSYLPPAPENMNNFSPHIANVIFDACGLLDSVFRQMTTDPVNLRGGSKHRKDLDIRDYAELYAEELRLSSLNSVLLVSPPKYLSPFAPWKDLVSSGSYRPLPWWRNYTNLKHDRIVNIKEARLSVAIESVCALHQVVSTAPELAKAIMRRAWIPAGLEHYRDQILETLEGGIASSSFLIETKLFVVSRGRKPLPEKLEEFNPADFNGSQRLMDFFARWERTPSS